MQSGIVLLHTRNSKFDMEVPELLYNLKFKSQRKESLIHWIMSAKALFIQSTVNSRTEKSHGTMYYLDPYVYCIYSLSLMVDVIW